MTGSPVDDSKAIPPTDGDGNAPVVVRHPGWRPPRLPWRLALIVVALVAAGMVCGLVAHATWQRVSDLPIVSEVAAGVVVTLGGLVCLRIIDWTLGRRPTFWGPRRDGRASELRHDQAPLPWSERLARAGALAVVLVCGTTSFVVVSQHGLPDDCRLDPSPPAVEVMVIWTGEELDDFCRVVRAYRHEDVAVDSVGTEIGSALVDAIAVGDAPDVAIIPQPSLVRHLGGLCEELEPLDDLWVVANPDDGIPAPWTSVVTTPPHEGDPQRRTWGVFVKGASKSMFWYRTDLVEPLLREGEPDPRVGDGWEWEFFRDTWLDRYLQPGEGGTRPPPLGLAAAPATRDDPDVRWALTDWFENQLLLADADRAAEDPRYEPLYQRLATSGSVDWGPDTDDYETLSRALNEMAQVWGRPEVFPTGEQHPTSTWQDDLGDRLGTPPAVALVFNPSFLAGQVDGLYEDGAVRAFRFPGMRRRNLAIVGGDIAVVPQDGSTAVGSRFVNWLTTREAMDIWSEEDQGYLAPNWGSPNAGPPMPGDQDLRKWLTYNHLLQSVTPDSDSRVLFDLSDDQFAIGRDEEGQVTWDDRATWDIFATFFAEVTQEGDHEDAIEEVIGRLRNAYTDSDLTKSDCP